MSSQTAYLTGGGSSRPSFRFPFPGGHLFVDSARSAQHGFLLWLGSSPNKAFEEGATVHPCRFDINIPQLRQELVLSPPPLNPQTPHHTPPHPTSTPRHPTAPHVPMSPPNAIPRRVFLPGGSSVSKSSPFFRREALAKDWMMVRSWRRPAAELPRQPFREPYPWCCCAAYPK